MKNTKYPRTYHISSSPGCSGDDKKSADDSSLENIPAVITEKLDGSNSGLNKAGVYARSHSTFTRNPWDTILWDIHSSISHYIPDDMFIFGENMYGIHSLEYRKLEHYFYVFGIRQGNTYLSWDDVLETCYLLDLATVPVLAEGVFTDIKKTVSELVINPSALDAIDVQTGIVQMEGCVIRNRASFDEIMIGGDVDRFNGNLMKWVRPNHVNTDTHWTKNWKKATLSSYKNERFS